ncbi:MAG: type I methionyl aminopeptidase [Clostridiales bacterium]|jgi:methionyl aminopeptidase|nr:type I methionyl aminopeptidase [Clostridiales bacterium]
MVIIKSSAEIVKMRKAGEIVALAFAAVKDAVRDGVTTGELNRIAHEVITSRGAVPSFLRYNGFPKSICASVNEVVIHGIPSEKTVLKNGDVISVDIGAYYDGYHGDRAVTFGVGDISDGAKRLIQTAEDAFWAGISHAREGERVSDISAAVQQTVESRGFSVVRDFVGHGVGSSLHESPEVPNYGQPGRGVRLYQGMTIAVEPMISAGRSEVRIGSDGWTVTTVDGSLSAHFEHSVAVTANEPLLLTAEV